MVRRGINTRIDFALFDVSKRHKKKLNDRGVNIGLQEAQRQMAMFIEQSGFMNPKIIKQTSQRKKRRKTLLEVRF